MVPIAENYLKLISAGVSVLDVGCGSWDLIKSHCDTVHAKYEAIDTLGSYFGRETVATRVENLAELSFPDNQFDLVVGNQTMEHWAEHGCSLRWGLFQCFRVCRIGGRVLMNVPIHFHGTKTFMLGDLTRIQKLFKEFSDDVTLEPWGKPSRPNPEVFPWPGYRPLREKPAYILDIHAVKDKCLDPCHFNNSSAYHGRVAQLINYPISFNVYRVLRKIGIFPKKFEVDRHY